MKLPNRISIEQIQKNLPNLTTSQLDIFSQSISISPTDVVSVDVKQLVSSSTNKSFSIRLIKWVEPYTISGVNYSLFYTEVDHNLSIGDKIFIEGGVYDSDNFISSKKYRKNSDGYRVLYVDRCKLVLDIEYTGDLPTNEEEIDNFVKIYVASSQEEFDYYCQTLSLRDDSGIIQNKFDLGFNNFLYLNGTFSITPGSYNLTSFASDFALTTTTSTLGDSFVVRGFTNSNTYFVNITSDVFSNNFTPYLNPGYTQSLSGFFNNGKLRIMNGNFTKNGVDFKNEYIYFFDVSSNTWKIDKTYLPTIITEQHFRKGKFKSGKFNQGLYGQHENRIKWQGDEIKWNLGTTLNVDWLSGVLDSTLFYDNSNFTIFDRNNLPQIRANSSNNGGAGYNYVFNTNFVGGDVINGNIFNMAVVYGTNSVVTSTLEDYLLNVGTTFSINISGGVYYNSDILFASVSNATLISSYVFNSFLNKCKSVNSEIEASVFLNSTYLSDKIVKIQDYEESNIVWFDENSNPINYKMYKFYLTQTNWLRLREFQNFYFQDLVINLPSSELLNFFDDKFSVGQYYQTYDPISGTPTKPSRRVLVQLSTKSENRNSPGGITSSVPPSNGNNLQPNDISLPSIDIFIEGGDDFDYATSSSYPRPFLGNTIDITTAYILDSDFVSGLFKDSRWISGNHFGYNLDYAFSSNGGYTASVTASNRELQLEIGPKLRYDILGTTNSVSQIAFLNGLYYDSTLNGGSNLVPLNDTYKILSIGSNLSGGRSISMQDIMTQSVLSTFGNFSSSKYLITKNANNTWNYIHPVKFQNSVISSGIFRRAYFQDCTFDNFEFDSTDRDLVKVSNKRKLLISDTIFDGDGNTIKSGLFQFSHFVAGNDSWNGGIFHQGVWNSSAFTYSFSPTQSLIYTKPLNSFRGGIFRNSTWIDGTFDNGLFYRNSSNSVPSSLVYSNNNSYYYYDNLTDNNLRWSWQSGLFKNGDFEKSNFESGLFSNGNFYDSNFLAGEATGGNFGKSNIPYQRTRVWTGTFSNVNTINAEFRSDSPKGNLERSSIVWNSGVFNSGVFGASVSNPYNPITQTFSSTWLNGTFNGGEFTDVAEWKNGIFNDGKFTSYYWYEVNNPRTPFELMSFTGASFSWQNGKFNGGEFGNGTTSSNSTWYIGEFNGGKFSGRYWRNGILTSGRFFGSSTYSTDILNYNNFISDFNSHYYGFWQDGFVSKNKDKFITDEKIFTQIDRSSSTKKKNPEVLFQNVLWNSGTFSNFDGEMNQSVWIDGTFEDGYFSNSAFNPYINLAVNVILPKTSSFILSDVLEPGRTYTMQVEMVSNPSGQLTSPINITTGFSGITSSTFVATTSKDLIVNFTGLTLSSITVYPGTQSGFRVSDSCIWNNGEANESDFYFSKWNQGVFDSTSTSNQGNAFGLIWKDGIVKYMNAYNVFWKGGIWKNGNWNGSPFTQISTFSNTTIVYPGFASDIINNIYLYASQSYAQSSDTIYRNWSGLHMNDAFTSSLITPVLTDPQLNFNFSSPSRSVDQNNSEWKWTNLPSVLGPFIGYLYAPPIITPAADFYIGNPIYGGNTSVIYIGGTTSNINGRKVWAYAGGTRNIFSDITKTYKIKIKYFAVYNSASISPTFPTNTGNPLPAGYPEDNYIAAGTTLSSLPLSFRISVGKSTNTFNNGGISYNISESLNLFTYGNGKFGTTGIKTLSYSFKPSQIDSSFAESQTLSIMRIAGDPNIRLYIYELSVEEQDLVYDSVTNNQLLNLVSTSNIQSLSSTINLPNNIVYSGIGFSDQSNPSQINTRFGNGQFLSGIWENGVWNEGWREDLTVIWCDNLSTFDGSLKPKSYKNDVWTWTFELNVLNSNPSNGLISDLQVGDKVSVGNIVTIDLNGNRRLIRDWMAITATSSTKLTLEVNINFPIRSIQKDSEEHLIYLTKNVWLNGIFLNGRFKDGVWNNGLFKGYPYITVMEDSQWIDGIFKGGRFTGLTGSYFDNNANELEYHKSVIQKFDFFDENVSGLPFKFKFNSWIDVNYYQTEGVNINRTNNVYKTTPLGFTASFIENNHYGYPTKDVLESNSTIRNAFDLNERTYRLGWKWKEYDDFLIEVGNFQDINQITFTNSSTASYNGFGVSNLLNDGWTFSYLSNDVDGFGTSSNSISSNIGNLDSEWLYLSGGRLSPDVLPPDDNANFTVDFFDNTNVSIDKLRYSFIEIEADNLGFTISNNSIVNPLVFYNNYPGSYSIAANNILFNGNNITIPVSQITSETVVNQREYFYNKRDLKMLIFAGGTYSLRFKKIRYVETDMIPFTQLADDCIQFKNYATWNTSPAVFNPGTYPYDPDPFTPGVDPGTWDLAQLPPSGNLQVLPLNGDPTWDNFYLVGNGSGCVSYINEDPQVPNVAIAPDLSSDIQFTYITAVNIPLIQTPIISTTNINVGGLGTNNGLISISTSGLGIV